MNRVDRVVWTFLIVFFEGRDLNDALQRVSQTLGCPCTMTCFKGSSLGEILTSCLALLHLVGVELIFLRAVPTVLCFRFVTKAMLISHFVVQFSSGLVEFIQQVCC